MSIFLSSTASDVVSVTGTSKSFNNLVFYTYEQLQNRRNEQTLINPDVTLPALVSSDYNTDSSDSDTETADGASICESTIKVDSVTEVVAKDPEHAESHFLKSTGSLSGGVVGWSIPVTTCVIRPAAPNRQSDVPSLTPAASPRARNHRRQHWKPSMMDTTVNNDPALTWSYPITWEDEERGITTSAWRCNKRGRFRGLENSPVAIVLTESDEFVPQGYPSSSSTEGPPQSRELLSPQWWMDRFEMGEDEADDQEDDDDDEVPWYLQEYEYDSDGEVNFEGF
ncbi:hypothetical protein FRB90_010241 [Tulasnella sp. 427]|nr:hypothetical protein FRB90_010241 [Tulasnella sp. 427]